MSSDAVARRVVVRGRVQGVFFRDSCSREARRAGVSGWVRNEPDGSVAALFEGPPPAVDQMVRWCHAGPPHARVEKVDVSEASPSGATAFDVLG
ncbi:MAG TPA: acylphosphatase [Nocardioidaceae bacterium]|nr:acylphosphatase [Nocardioidaceae bacterium]